MPPVRVGVSACLLGQRVRYDGTDRLCDFVARLGQEVELHAVCPEVEVGMGVPRETVRLAGRPARMLGNETGADWTLRMQGFAARRIAALGALDGYVWKSNSPSCGVADVPRAVSLAPGAPLERDGVGLFAASVKAARPFLPLTDERRLAEPAARGHFLTRVFAHARLRAVFAEPWSVEALAAHHAREALLLLAHGAAAPSTLDGFLGAAASSLGEPEGLRAAYEEAFARALERPATERGHAQAAKQAAALPREVAAAQTYLAPDPRETRLRLA